MKKLMIGLVGALAMVASAEVASSNTVGFQNTTSGNQNNFVAIPFSAVGYNTSDIQMIKISDGGAETIGWGTETFAIWQGVPSVVAGSTFLYYDPSMDPNEEATDFYWGDYDCNSVSYSIAAGQGVVLGLTEGLEVSYAGEVANDNVMFTSIAGNNFAGNTFAANIDIQDIAISDGGAESIGWGTETFAIWEGVPTVKIGSSFLYYDSSMDPNEEATDFYWGDYDCNAVSYNIEPGQGFVLGLTAGLEVSIKAPY